MRTWVLCAAVAAFLAGIAATGVSADWDNDDNHHYTVISSYGATPFVYSGYTYVPLKSTADFLGAGLLWDSLHNRATVVYRNHKLGLAIGSTTAYWMGQPVVLPVPPIMVGEQMLVPAVVFDRYFEVPVRWEAEDNRVLIMGPPGWGYYQVLPYAPPHIVTIIERYGPPPWAPAHGYRRRHGYPAVYVPAPFVYYGVTYIPLRDAADVLGAVLLWDHLRNRAMLTYNGRDIALVIGSPTVYYGPQVIALPGPPVIVGGAVYVPSDLFERHMHVPIEHREGVLKLKGPKGWREFGVASAPPGQVYGAPERWRERERARERSRVGLPTRRGPEPGRGGGPWVKPAQGPVSKSSSPPAKPSGWSKGGGKSAGPSAKGGGWSKEQKGGSSGKGQGKGGWFEKSKGKG